MAEQDPPETPQERAAALLERVAALVAEHRLAELIVEETGLLIRVKGMDSEPAPPSVITVPIHPQMLTEGQMPAYSQAPVLAPASAPTTASAASAPAQKASATRIAQESPMVGVFYRSPSPEDPPFVNVGDLVSIGQTVGLIEAMKVYSELPSEVAGRVTEILVQNGKLVQQGQPIFYVEPV